MDRMNQNDMDRYFWRTGQRWSGDDRVRNRRATGPKVSRGLILLLFVAFIATSIYVIASGSIPVR